MRWPSRCTLFFRESDSKSDRFPYLTNSSLKSYNEQGRRNFGSLCAPTVLLLGCVWYGNAAKDPLLVFAWEHQQILEHTLTSPMIPKESEAATWICFCNTWQHIFPSVAKKASTTSTAKSTAATAGQSHPLSSSWLSWLWLPWLSKSSGRSVFELESCHRLIGLGMASLTVYWDMIRTNQI